MGENITGARIKEVLSETLRKYSADIWSVDEEQLQKSLTLLINLLTTEDEAFNANVLISADKKEDAEKYIDIFDYAISKIISKDNHCRFSEKEEELYDWENLKKINTGTRILFVKNFKGKDPERLYKTLLKFEKNGFDPAVVLCCDKNTVENLRQYTVDDHRLYNYLCGYKIVVPGINENHIFKSSIDRLENIGYEITDEFKERLKNYVNAIYPEAVLSEKAFIDDLINRINQVHFGKSINPPKVLDAEDVPYSVKAEKLWEKVQGNGVVVSECADNGEKENTEETIEKPEVGKDEEVWTEFDENELSSVNDYFIKRMISYLNDDKGFDFSKVENEVDGKLTDDKEHQVLLLGMSTFRYDKAKEKYELEKNEFHTSTDKIEDCRGQLEPIAKMMLNKIDGLSTVDFVIVSTKDTTEKNFYIKYGQDMDEPIKVKDNNDNDIVTPLIYKDDKTNKKVIFHIVQVSETAPLEGMQNTVEAIRGVYSKYNYNKKHIHLWLDIHGGFRDVNVMMAALLSLLKNEEIESEKIYSVRYSGKNEIFEAKEMFSMFDFVTGMNEFFEYGHSRALENLFENKKKNKDECGIEDKKEGSDEKQNVEKEAYIEGIKYVDEGIQFSNAQTFRQGINKMKEAIKKPSDNQMLNIFSENIKEDFGELINQNKKTSTLMLVKRCVKKGMFQQALTLLESWIFEDYYKDGIVYLNENGLDSFLKKSDSVTIDKYGNFVIEYERKDKEGKNTSNKPFEAKLNKDNKDDDKKKIFLNLILYCSDFLIDGDNGKKDIGDKFLKNLDANNLEFRKAGKSELKAVDKSFLCFNDNKLNFIKTKLPEEQETREKAGKLLRLHKALKGCRNKFNHADSGRPSIETVDKAFKEYFATYEYLLDKLKEQESKT